MYKKTNVNIIVELIKRMKKKGLSIGKTQFQKLIYFLQEIEIPLDYYYEIFHYGPFSFKLSNDLELFDVLGILNIVPDVNGYGYDISEGEFSNSYHNQDDNIIKKYEKQINFIIENFGECEIPEIELKATIHFVNKKLKDKNPEISKGDIFNLVHELKPKFSRDYIEKSYNELNKIIKLV